MRVGGAPRRERPEGYRWCEDCWAAYVETVDALCPTRGKTSTTRRPALKLAAYSGLCLPGAVLPDGSFWYCRSTAQAAARQARERADAPWADAVRPFGPRAGTAPDTLPDPSATLLPVGPAREPGRKGGAAGSSYEVQGSIQKARGWEPWERSPWEQSP